MARSDRIAFRTSPPPTLEQELARFAELQQSLVDRWTHLRDVDAGQRDVVVVPSLSIEGVAVSSIPGVTHYEERMLFALSLLRHPRAHLVYVTSQPLSELQIGYMLGLVHGIPTSHARERLTLLCTYDAGSRPLTDKILERPRLIDRIRRAIDPARAHMTCFTVSASERSLAVRLGIPLYGVDPKLLDLGTKSGSRRVFRAAGVRMPEGVEDVRRDHEVAEAIVELCDQDPARRRFVMKLNVGYSGEGNAVVDLSALPEAAPGKASRSSRVELVQEHLAEARFGSAVETWPLFRDKLRGMGGVVEEFIEGRRKRAPSGQIRINPRGELEAMSTHDQVTSGPDDQVYAGCRFPADAAYRERIQTDALAVGAALQAHGVVGRVGIDFVTVERSAEPGTWDQYAIEINLRMTGTTHPLMLMKMLNDGHYDPKSGLYRTRRGAERFYVASDSLRSPSYVGLMVEDLLDIAAVHDLHYKPWTDTGVVFHLTGALSQFGKVGITAIGDSPEDAQRWFDAVRDALDAETAPPKAPPG